MKRQLWLGILGIVTLSIGCSGESGEKQAQSGAIQTPPTAQNFSTPLTNSSAKPIARPVPGLLQPTNAATRIPSIVTGRRDPFAVVPGSDLPIVISSRSIPSRVAVSPLPRSVSKLPTQAVPSKASVPSLSLPPIAVGSYPNLPNLAPLPPGNLPPIRIPVAPPSPTSVADAIAVNGVVQVGGKWTVIVKEPSAGSSRYVAVGEYLENGRVLVKKIVSAGSADPVVVLQQNGVEIRKSLG
ncbi:hypothetical protein JOY44_06035 [Phormidium sp. CLA17]|uniref:hypothetical protein n=1 Tax=Leptolyngbya sp. Cla-17 TaxID=2803751 RepID=UPI001493107A|nr:hypothetical protein [Leptolyngbya sp. Cla-17]MBM0741181.1 hypothetical protein [Leptolyngbya sp. Cla-17]